MVLKNILKIVRGARENKNTKEEMQSMMFVLFLLSLLLTIVLLNSSVLSSGMYVNLHTLHDNWEKLKQIHQISKKSKPCINSADDTWRNDMVQTDAGPCVGAL